MAEPPNPHETTLDPSLSTPKPSFIMLYYGLVMVGIAAIVLALYNLLIIKWCMDFAGHGSRRRASRSQGPTSSSWRPLKKNTNFVSSFKYEKDGVENDDSECAVCLSEFEEGEELKQLAMCKHCFHAACIDMWLYSHIDCPLCRSPVEPPPLLHRPTQPEHSQEGLLGQDTSV